MSLLFDLLLGHPLVFFCLKLFLSFMILFATSVSDFLLETLSSRSGSYPWTKCALFTLFLLSIVLGLHLELPELLLLLCVLQLHSFDCILIYSVKSSLVLCVNFILNCVPAFFICFKCAIFVNCQSVRRFCVNDLVVEVFIHSLFLDLTVVWHSIHFTIHQEVWFFLIDAWLVPVCLTTTDVFWFVYNCFISVFESCWLSFSPLLSRCTTSWPYILLFIVISFLVPVLVGILTEVVVLIFIGWRLPLRILVLRASLRLSGLIASSRWTTCSLSSSAGCSHSVGRLQLPAFRLSIWIRPLPMPARNVLTLSQLSVSLIKVIMLFSIRREIVSINIKIDWLIVLKMWLLSLIICPNSTLSALLPRSTKRDLWRHHPVLNHIVGIIRRLSHLLVIILIISFILHSASCLCSSASSISSRIWISLAMPTVFLRIISIVLIRPHNVFVIKLRFLD